MKVRDCFAINPAGNTSRYTDFINYIDTSSVNAGSLCGVSFLEEDFPSRAQRLVKQGDILYSSVRPNLRHYHLYKDKYKHVVASTGFVLLRNKSGYNAQFAFYYLSTNEIVKHLSNIAELSQSTFPSFSPKDIGKIDLPEIDTLKQKKIVAILSTYDNLIEVNNKRIKVLEQMAENLYKEWFVRFRFPGHESVPFEYGLPQGWEFNRIGELFSTSSGGTPSRQNAEYYEDGKYMWVKTGELLDRFIIDTEEKITEDALKNSAAKIIPPYSLLCSMYAGVGKLGINAEPITCSQATCVFRPKTFLSLHYLFFWLKLNRIYLESISFGAAQQNISQDIIKKIKIMVPTDSVTRRFDNMINPVFQQILFLQRQIKKLTQMRDLLLPRLMSGKLEV